MKVHSQETINKDLSEIQEIEGVPICYANLKSPVTDREKFIHEITYKNGRLYIENAD